VPRAIAAWKVPGICPDAVLYINLGKAFEAGNAKQALGNIRFNIYPLVLAGLHRMGMGWELAGVAWGVVISSCTVLPLYGWVRRMFDRRLALGAGFLYAVHPGLIRWSVEVIRDSTFWFLLTISIYLLWRAVTELHWAWYAAAGTTIALACLTRFEGLTLYALLAVWSVGQGARSRVQGAWSAERTGNTPCSSLRAPCYLRLALGAMICASIYPLALLLINGLWHHGAVTELVRSQPAELAQSWMQESFSGQREAKMLARPDVLPPLPAWKLVDRFATGLYKGLSPLYLVVLGCGIAVNRKRIFWPRRKEGAAYPLSDSNADPTTIFLVSAFACMAAPILLAVWVHLYWSHEAGPRYFFPIVILAAPLASRGLWRLIAAAGQVASLRAIENDHSPKPKRANGILSSLALPVTIRPAIALLAAFAIVQMAIAFSGDSRSRAAAMELGQWIHAHYGPGVRIIGPDGFAQVAAHFAQGESDSYSDSATSTAVVVKINRWRPAVVLLAANGNSPAQNDLSQRIEALGFRPIDRTRLPRECDGLKVMARPAFTAASEMMEHPTIEIETNDCKLRIVNCKMQM